MTEATHPQTQSTVQIRLVAPTQAAAKAALARLTLITGVQHWSEPRQGRRGDWLVYGRLALDAAPGQATCNSEPEHESRCPGAAPQRQGVDQGRESP